MLCEEVSCPTLHCYFPFTPAGECCPICMESGKEPAGTRVCWGSKGKLLQTSAATFGFLIIYAVDLH